MRIKALGHSSFRISRRGFAIVTDPFDPATVGLSFPRVEADIVTISHSHKDHNYLDRIEGNPIIISGPGEYEIKGVRISGIASFHDIKMGKERGENTIYNIMLDDVNIVHLGDLGHKLEDRQMDKLPNVDILMIPTGGYYTIDAKTASNIVTQLEPKIVIPMHYRQHGLAKNLADQLEPIDGFLKELGEEKISPRQSLILKKREFPPDMQVVILEYA